MLQALISYLFVRAYGKWIQPANKNKEIFWYQILMYFEIRGLYVCLCRYVQTSEGKYLKRSFVTENIWCQKHILDI